MHINKYSKPYDPKTIFKGFYTSNNEPHREYENLNHVLLQPQLS